LTISAAVRRLVRRALTRSRARFGTVLLLVREVPGSNLHTRRLLCHCNSLFSTPPPPFRAYWRLQYLKGVTEACYLLSCDTVYCRYLQRFEEICCLYLQGKMVYPADQCCPTFLYIRAHLTDGCGGAGAVWRLQ
jgi:hypothetical protein